MRSHVFITGSFAVAFLVSYALTLKDQITVTTDTLLLCFGKNDSVVLNAKEVYVVFSQHDNLTKNHVPTSGSRSCNLQITGQRDRALSVLVTKHTCTTPHSTVSVSDGVSQELWTGCEEFFFPGVDFTSHMNTVNVKITLHNHSVSFSLRMAITAVGPYEPDELELRYVTDTQGYVQTPGWDPTQQVFYPVGMNSTVVIHIPQNQTAVVSLVRIDVKTVIPYLDCLDKLWIFEISESEDYVDEKCGVLRESSPAVMFASFLVRFASSSVADHVAMLILDNTSFKRKDVERRHTGFRLIFTFHQESSLLYPTGPGRKLQCSVPSWPELAPHYSCDFQVDCEGEEDETGCSQQCGVGGFAVGTSCYYVGRRREDLQGRTADTECRRSGGRLVSFNTLHEWNQVLWNLRRSHVPTYFYGLRLPLKSWPVYYRSTYRWEDGSVAFLPPYGNPPNPRANCAYFSELDKHYFQTLTCNDDATDYRYRSYVCEHDPNQVSQLSVGPLPKTITLHHAGKEDTMENLFPFDFILCRTGHWTHAFLACDVSSECWARRDVNAYSRESVTWGMPVTSTCQESLTSMSPFFRCENGEEHVPYSTVCDFRQDCWDGSDEDFCVFLSCLDSVYFTCQNGQCIPLRKLCDGIVDCRDASDEEFCGQSSLIGMELFYPTIIDFDRQGAVIMRPLAVSDPSNASLACPESHFMCVTARFCVPVYVRCNGVHDCPGKEDEADCRSYTCPGFYRCRGSTVCLHPSHLCDDIPQCPQYDDERFCNLTCPTNCTCQGLSYLCTQPFPAHLHPAVRYLDARGSGMKLIALRNNSLLVHLSLAYCDVTYLDDVKLPNILSLDLSENQISAISVAAVKKFQNLQVLFLAGNPIVFLFSDNASLSPKATALRHLDLSRVSMTMFDFSAVAPFRQLEKLNLSHSGAQQLLEGLVGEPSIFPMRELDVRGCPAHSFSRTLFQGMQGLQAVYADNYKMCCPAMLPPGLSASKCWAPADEVSSCDTLLRFDVYRVALAVFAALALTGNLVSFIVRSFVETTGRRSGFLAFVIHLCVADFLMGAYLAVIGTADRLYLGTYLWEEEGWRSSQTCAVAGFLCILSSEVSAMLICLITLDRFLVMRFPLSQAHFRFRSAHAACTVTWLTGSCLAAVPLLPVTSHWRFYSQTGICVPLPITKTDFAGRDYAFAVMIVVNFVLFVFIAAGQLSIYASINMNKMSAVTHAANTSRDARIARRLAVVVVSDFTCWFPIGLLGVLARSGTAIPGEVNVAMAILVLPLNSALNPFLYTLNMVLERRQRAAEDILLQQLLLPPTEAEQKSDK